MLFQVIFLTIAILALLFFVPKVRKTFLTPAVFRWFKQQLPPISSTERDAIDAGDLSVEADLFRGKPHWDTILNIPNELFTKEETAFLENQTEVLCQMLNDWEITQRLFDLPPSVWDYLKKEKFFGMIIPKQYGGLEFSAKMHSAVIIKIAARSVSAAVTTMVPNSLGPAELLLHYGTEEQRHYYLPRLANGTDIPCFALTSPVAGSDAGSITDIGVVCEEVVNGKKVLGLRLTWEKRYITLAPVATVIGLVVRVFDPEHLLGQAEEIGITLLLVPRNYPGVEAGPRHDPIHMAFMNGTTSGKDVFVPMDMVIGGQNMLGQGWRMLMGSLAAGRAISLPALSAATAALCYRSTSSYAYLREQFKLPIGQFEGIQMPLGRIAGLTYLMESARRMTLNLLDTGKKPAIISAIMKYHMTELSRQIINHAMDIHGGKGIILGPKNYLANAYCAMPVSITVEGANILTRCLIIFGQGAFRCHPHVRYELEAAQITDENAALELFDHHLVRHVKYIAYQKWAALFSGLTSGFFTETEGVPKFCVPYVRQINGLARALSFTSEVAMMCMGGKLKRKENLSARLGDVLSHLYLAAAVVWFTQKRTIDQDEEAHAIWALQYAIANAKTALFEFYRNYTPGYLGMLIKHWCFPLGTAIEPPNDALTFSLAQMSLKPSKLRDTLSLFAIPNDKERFNPLLSLEHAFVAVHANTAIYDKIKAALKNGVLTHAISRQAQIEAALSKGIISSDEYQRLKDAEVLRNEVIQVNHWTNKE